MCQLIASDFVHTHTYNAPIAVDHRDPNVGTRPTYRATRTKKAVEVL